MNAIGCCGLQLYHFGETVSIPFWNESWKPDSFVDKIESNLQRGLHTLCLLGMLNKSKYIPRKTELEAKIDVYNSMCALILTVRNFLCADIKVKEQSIENMMK